MSTLRLASSTWNEDERQALLDVIDSGLHTMGSRVADFEKAFAQYVGTKYAVMVNSGSSAMLLIAAAYTLRYGAGTITAPVLGWSTSYSPFQQYGWKFRFVDIDDSLNIDPYTVNENDMVLAINILGNPCEYKMLPQRGMVFEDNCESLGAQYNGKRTGTFGVMAGHSFFFSHHICTMEGGAVTTDDEYFYHMLLSLRSHGWTRNLPENNALKAKVDKFHFILPGYNVRPIEMMAAVGLKQLEKLDRIVEQRRANAEACPIKLQREVGKSSWYGFAVYDTDIVRRNCETRPVVSGNFLLHPVSKHYKFEVGGKLRYIGRVSDMVMVGNSAQPIDWSWARD